MKRQLGFGWCGRVAALGMLVMFSPAWASDVDDPPADDRSTALSPPAANDHTFVLDTGGGLDTGCSYHSDGPLIIQVPVTRYLGPTNADGTLAYAHGLTQRGLLSEYAIVQLAVYDVDYACGNDPTCERDRVSFNGVPVHTLNPVNQEYLQGANATWKLNFFQIPIECVKFPSARGVPDPNHPSAPVPAINEIRIDIDVTNHGWCVAADWAALSIKCMSPIILVHGNGSNGGFFVRRGFTNGLNGDMLLWDNSISLEPISIRRNSLQLNELIPHIVRSFGADSAHLVAHSKGGLDARDYLAEYQPGHDGEYKILSLTTLSTPHDGSMLADLSVQHHDAAVQAVRSEFPGFPHLVWAIDFLSGTDFGRYYLQTTWCSTFAKSNVRKLPRDVVYNTIAADADQNGNGRIDWASPDESLEMRQEEPNFNRIVADDMYQMLASYSTVSYAIVRRGGISVARFSGVANVPRVGNDIMVTIPSALGTGAFATCVPPLAGSAHGFVGPGGRNHASVADAGVTNVVMNWVVSAEHTNGDWK